MEDGRETPLLVDESEAAAPAPPKDPPPPTTARATAIAIARIAWPVSVSWLVQWSQSFFTIWLIGGAGEELSMAAYGLANVVCNVTGHSFLWGIGAGLDTLASQAWGAREHAAVGLAGQRVLLILTLVVNVPVVAIWLNATPLLIALGQERDIATHVAAFARVRVPGLFCQAPVCVLTKSLTAMGKTKPLLAINLGGVALSLGLAWLLIARASPASGRFDPIVGSAVMSTSVDAASALALLGVAACDADCRRCWPGWSRRAWDGWRPYLKLAVPALLMGIFEWWSWDIVNFLAGLCPEPKTALASNALLGQIISLAYCAPGGLQAGTQTLVGNALGAQAPRAARRAAHVGLALAAGVMGAQAVALFALRGRWAALFSSEPEVGREVRRLLQWVVVFNAGDGVQLVVSGAITGAGKQGATPLVLFVAYWVLGLPLGALAAFHAPRNGLLGLWWGMTLAVWLHVAAYLAMLFAYPRVKGAIDWPRAARAAAARLAEPAADAAAGLNPAPPEEEYAEPPRQDAG